jgi:glycerophosphoryl diester phosphodiesterase
VVSSRHPGSALVVAHRGGRGPDRENSIAAFARAGKLGADMIECDVRATLEGALVLLHDGKVAGRRVESTRLVELAAQLGFRPDLLEEAVASLPAGLFLDVEVKQTGCERSVLEAVSGLAPERLLLTSFEPEVLNRLRRLSSTARLGLIVPVGGPLDKAVACARACGASHLVLHHRRVGPEALAAAGRAGLTVFVWTVNARRELLCHFQEPRVRGVVTDEVELAVSLRARG